MVHRFWGGFARGGYVGHGETYLHAQDILWWSKGGLLYGQSPERIAFLRKVFEEGHSLGIDPISTKPDWDCRVCVGVEPDYYLHYFEVHQPAFRDLDLPDGHKYTVEIIDPWEMTITPLEGAFEGQCRIELPGRPYLAARIRRVL